MLAGVLPFAVSYALMAMLPGPNFAAVAQAGLCGRRGTAFAAAAGIAGGASLLAAAMTGGAGLVLADEATRRFASAFYGAVLIFIGCRAAFRSATAGAGAKPPVMMGFRLAFLTAATNPASALFFGAAASHAGKGGGPLLVASAVFVVAFAWFGLMAQLLSLPRLRVLHGRFGRQVEVGLGGALAIFGCLAV